MEAQMMFVEKTDPIEDSELEIRDLEDVCLRTYKSGPGALQ